MSFVPTSNIDQILNKNKSINDFISGEGRVSFINLFNFNKVESRFLLDPEPAKTGTLAPIVRLLNL